MQLYNCHCTSTLQMTVIGGLEPQCLWAALAQSPGSEQHRAATGQPHGEVAAVSPLGLTGCLHLLMSLFPKQTNTKNPANFEITCPLSFLGRHNLIKKIPMLLPYAWSIDYVILILLATINKQVLKPGYNIMSVFHYFFFLETLTIYTKWKWLQMPGIFYQLLFLQACVKSCVFTKAYNVFHLF